MPMTPQKKKCHQASGAVATWSSVRLAKKNITVTSAAVT
jgi:hypothetical protein